MCTRHNQRGISLVELIMFIVIVSVALAGILLVMNTVTRGSADPLIHKQSLAIAESLLEEVELMPFTYCDPDDPTAATATSTAECSVRIESAGLDAAFVPYQAIDETRYSNTAPFDNVNDYDAFSMSGAGGIKDITGAAISAALNGYSASINVSNTTLPDVAAGDALLIAVTVTGPDGVGVVVEGIRTRYAPRMLP
jgi:MSHA pilin protein MshD